MKNTVYKIYELEEVLSQYKISNGELVLLNASDSTNEGTKGVEPKDSFDEEIDAEIERGFLEDIGEIENITKEELIKRIKRYQSIVKKLKEKYKYKCQLCGYTFHMDNENYYCEAHHIKSLSKDGSQYPENTIILCANHHRMFHYASSNCIIGNLVDGKRIIKIGAEVFTVQY